MKKDNKAISSCVRDFGISMLSLGFSAAACYIAYSTYSKTIPKERPFISIYKNGVDSVKDNKFWLNITFKNTGYHPAKKIDLQVAQGTLNSTNTFQKLEAYVTPNPMAIDDEFKWGNEVKIDPLKTKLIFLIRIKYLNLYSNDKYCEDFWMTYTVGHAGLTNANENEVKENKDLEKFVSVCD